jgi:hypothetical protein
MSMAGSFYGPAVEGYFQWICQRKELRHLHDMTITRHDPFPICWRRLKETGGSDELSVSLVIHTLKV